MKCLLLLQSFHTSCIIIAWDLYWVYNLACFLLCVQSKHESSAITLSWKEKKRKEALKQDKGVSAWCASMKSHTCVGRFESPEAWQYLKFLKWLISIWLFMLRVSGLLPAVHNTRASGTVKTLFVLTGSPKAEQAWSQNCSNRHEILAVLTSMGVLP